MTRTRHADTQREREQIVDTFITQGYSVVTQGETSTRVRYRDYGGVGAHVLVFIVFGWWTLGVANLLYAVYRRHRTTDTVVVKET